MKYPVIKRFDFADKTYIEVEFETETRGTVIDSTSFSYKIGEIRYHWTSCNDKKWKDVEPKLAKFFALPDELFEVE